MTRWGRRRADDFGQEERAAAQQVVDMFATEALLALDRYERSMPSHERGRRTADRLAYWWRRLRMDDPRVGADRPGSSEAERILASAAEQSLDPGNRFGIDVGGAIEQASVDSVLAGRGPVHKRIADFRDEFDEAYGGQADVPSEADDWLGQSLTNLARASVLRDVVGGGAWIKVNRSTRAAAEQMARHGQQLIAGRERLAADRDAPDARDEAMMRQASTMLAFSAYSSAVHLTGAPPWLQGVLHAPAGAILFVKSVENWTAYQDAPPTPQSHAQARLRSVRTNTINNLNTPTRPTRDR